MSERRFRSLTAVPGMEHFREEGIAQPSDPFGSTEFAIQTVIPELHIYVQDGHLAFTLSNPVRFGPVAVVHGGKDERLVPGETIIVDEPNSVVLMQRQGVIELILFDRADLLPIPLNFCQSADDDS